MQILMFYLSRSCEKFIIETYSSENGTRERCFAYLPKRYEVRHKNPITNPEAVRQVLKHVPELRNLKLRYFSGLDLSNVIELRIKDSEGVLLNNFWDDIKTLKNLETLTLQLQTKTNHFSDFKKFYIALSALRRLKRLYILFKEECSWIEFFQGLKSQEVSIKKNNFEMKVKVLFPSTDPKLEIIKHSNLLSESNGFFSQEINASLRSLPFENEDTQLIGNAESKQLGLPINSKGENVKQMHASNFENHSFLGHFVKPRPIRRANTSSKSMGMHEAYGSYKSENSTSSQESNPSFYSNHSQHSSEVSQSSLTSNSKSSSKSESNHGSANFDSSRSSYGSEISQSSHDTSSSQKSSTSKSSSSNRSNGSQSSQFSKSSKRSLNPHSSDFSQSSQNSFVPDSIESSLSSDSSSHSQYSRSSTISNHSHSFNTSSNNTGNSQKSASPSNTHSPEKSFTFSNSSLSRSNSKQANSSNSPQNSYSSEETSNSSNSGRASSSSFNSHSVSSSHNHSQSSQSMASYSSKTSQTLAVSTCNVFPNLSNQGLSIGMKFDADVIPIQDSVQFFFHVQDGYLALSSVQMEMKEYTTHHKNTLSFGSAATTIQLQSNSLYYALKPVEGQFIRDFTQRAPTFTHLKHLTFATSNIIEFEAAVRCVDLFPALVTLNLNFHYENLMNEKWRHGKSMSIPLLLKSVEKKNSLKELGLRISCASYSLEHIDKLFFAVFRLPNFTKFTLELDLCYLEEIGASALLNFLNINESIQISALDFCWDTQQVKSSLISRLKDIRTNLTNYVAAERSCVKRELRAVFIKGRKT